jgi:2',3'-cyclic-nucleotide 2'-phosphodiesterase (5'-nucleotidase family)
MRTKYFSLIITILLFAFSAQGQEKQSNTIPQKEISENAVYRLFPTPNMYNFIKLNTRNGKMSQVQWGTESKYRFESILSDISRVNYDEEKNGRFFLYSTTNTYNLILLDQIDGRTWQVQWSTEEKDRMVLRIY